MGRRSYDKNFKAKVALGALRRVLCRSWAGNTIYILVNWHSGKSNCLTELPISLKDRAKEVPKNVRAKRERGSVVEEGGPDESASGFSKKSTVRYTEAMRHVR